MGLDQSKWHYLCKSTSLVNCSPPLRSVWDGNKMVWRKRLMAVLCFWQSFLLQGSTPPPCHRLDDSLMRRVQLRQQTAAPGEFLEITKKIHVDCNQIWYFSENTELALMGLHCPDSYTPHKSHLIPRFYKLGNCNFERRDLPMWFM